MGRHTAPRPAAPKKRSARTHDKPRISAPPILPLLAVAVTGLSTLGAGALGTTQAAAEVDAARPQLPATSIVSVDGAQVRQHEGGFGPSSRDLARSALEQTPLPRRDPGLTRMPDQAGDEYADRDVVSTGSCEASYYNTGAITANGESFDPSKLTAAHKTLPFGTMVRVVNKANDKSVVVRINDRGPYIAGRCLDLTPPGMRAIAGPGVGTADIEYQVLGEK